MIAPLTDTLSTGTPMSIPPAFSGKPSFRPTAFQRFLILGVPIVVALVGFVLYVVATTPRQSAPLTLGTSAQLGQVNITFASLIRDERRKSIQLVFTVANASQGQVFDPAVKLAAMRDEHNNFVHPLGSDSRGWLSRAELKPGETYQLTVSATPVLEAAKRYSFELHLVASNAGNTAACRGEFSVDQAKAAEVQPSE